MIGRRSLVTSAGLLLLAAPGIVRAQQFPHFLGGTQPVAPSPLAWSTVNKNANMALSNFDLTVTSTWASPNQACGIANTSYGTGALAYYEIVVNEMNNFDSDMLGMGNASTDLSDGAYIGIDTNSGGFIADGRVIYGNSILATITGYNPGDTLCVANRFDDQTAFFRINAGNWNDDPTANPATNTGGYSFPISGPLFPAYCAQGDGGGQSQYTLSTSAAFSVPSGFTYVS